MLLFLLISLLTFVVNVSGTCYPPNNEKIAHTEKCVCPAGKYQIQTAYYTFVQMDSYGDGGSTVTVRNDQNVSIMESKMPIYGDEGKTKKETFEVKPGTYYFNLTTDSYPDEQSYEILNEHGVSVKSAARETLYISNTFSYTISDVDNVFVCKSCPAGFSSPIASTSCSECPSGSVSSAGSSSCFECEAGKYSDGDCKLCPGGKYQNENSQTVCNECASGHVSSAGSSSCFECEAGKYSDGSDGVCKSCPSGQYQNQTGQTVCNECASGHVSSAGSSSCFECQPGKYSDGSDGVCKSCPSGFSSPNASTPCSECPSGSGSSTGSSSCSECQAGKYADGDCKSCPEGKYQDQTGKDSCESCPSGQYQEESGKDECVSCPAGKFVKFSVDYYNESMSAENSIGYSLSKYCDIYTVNDVRGDANCKADYTLDDAKEYCSSNDWCVKIMYWERCLSGCDYRWNTNRDRYWFLKVGGNSPTANLIADLYTKRRVYSCLECPSGSGSSTGSSSCSECQAGKYVDGDCKSCPEGKYQDQTGKASCESCPSGQYQEETGKTSCESCPSGKYQDESGKVECTACPLGSGSDVGSSSCTECLAGQYADGSDGVCKSCPSGKYQDESGKDECTACPLGSGSDVGSSSCTECEAGKYSDGSDGVCKSCPSGFVSPKASASCTCPAGNYQTQTAYYTFVQMDSFGDGGSTVTVRDGQDNQIMSSTMPTSGEEGKKKETPFEVEPNTIYSFILNVDDYWDEQSYEILNEYGVSVKSVVNGYNSGLVSGDNEFSYTISDVDYIGVFFVCESCPAGFSSPIASTSCSECEAGKYQNQNGQIACSECALGWGSSAGSSSCFECEAGKYSDGSDGDCKSCPSGQYQDESGKGECKSCPVGTSSPTGSPGSSSCFECEAGKYSDGSDGDCKSCPSGFSSLSGSNSCVQDGDAYDPIYLSSSTVAGCTTGQYQTHDGSKCENCYQGKYLDEAGLRGSNLCKSCPHGKFTPNNDIGYSQCGVCQAGQYQDQVGQSACESCPNGWKSAAGSSSCSQCAAGMYSNALLTGCVDCSPGLVSSAGSSSCSQCAAGKYQNQFGNIACKNCQPGKYEDAQGSPECKNCPAGKYEDAQGSPECKNCPAGKYEDAQGSPECKNCQPGKYEDVQGSQECKNCPTGYYEDAQGSPECKSCATGWYSNIGTDHADGCYCDITTPSYGSWNTCNYHSPAKCYEGAKTYAAQNGVSISDRVEVGSWSGSTAGDVNGCWISTGYTNVHCAAGAGCYRVFLNTYPYPTNACGHYSGYSGSGHSVCICPGIHGNSDCAYSTFANTPWCSGDWKESYSCCVADFGDNCGDGRYYRGVWTGHEVYSTGYICMGRHINANYCTGASATVINH